MPCGTRWLTIRLHKEPERCPRCPCGVCWGTVPPQKALQWGMWSLSGGKSAPKEFQVAHVELVGKHIHPERTLPTAPVPMASKGLISCERERGCTLWGLSLALLILPLGCHGHWGCPGWLLEEPWPTPGHIAASSWRRPWDQTGEFNEDSTVVGKSAMQGHHVGKERGSRSMFLNALWLSLIHI